MKVIGRISLTVVSRGPFQNANLGYYLDKPHNGRGYSTEAVQLCLHFAFRECRLHRVQAGVMPINNPSMRVLEKNGIRQEGLAKRYLKLNDDVWADHNIYAITAEDYHVKTS
ncbi:hypothetical protein CVD28_23770 [Bacillus sp. M6-12]|uniref:GNAT family N-acetyltransferase n=1 Tax=Bacillus sp. M6-12 TaxID=2054166 RepID=UPI000C76A774|nr:GNAT family protein [Bacillus sp. M6-12]PLS15345.1 hypothetical protein CVD28_23770 [Bacillus sp. M6-12]